MVRCTLGERQGFALLPYFPLANGLLTGKYRLGQPLLEGVRLSASGKSAEWFSEANLQKVEALIRFAEAHGHTLLELAVSWLLSKPVVASVIAGATKGEQVTANGTAANWHMTADEIVEIERLAA